MTLHQSKPEPSFLGTFWGVYERIFIGRCQLSWRHKGLTRNTLLSLPLKTIAYNQKGPLASDVNLPTWHRVFLQSSLRNSKHLVLKPRTIQKKVWRQSRSLSMHIDPETIRNPHVTNEMRAFFKFELSGDHCNSNTQRSHSSHLTSWKDPCQKLGVGISTKKQERWRHYSPSWPPMSDRSWDWE